MGKIMAIVIALQLLINFSWHLCVNSIAIEDNPIWAIPILSGIFLFIIFVLFIVEKGEK